MQFCDHRPLGWKEKNLQKYFIRTANQRVAQKTITALQAKDGNTIYSNRDILKECAAHYKVLYASKNPYLESFKEFALAENVNRLTEEEKLPCEGPITKEEGKIALAGMALNKTAGVSGFSAEFFAAFWEEMGDLITDYINEAKQKRQLFIRHRRAVLTLIPKKFLCDVGKWKNKFLGISSRFLNRERVHPSPGLQRPYL